MGKKRLQGLLTAAVLFGLVGLANATAITSYYGDDDGFGVGATSTVDPNVSHQGIGEAAYTDLRLIGGPYSPTYPDFAPTGNFSAFTVDGPITSAILTLRTGSFDSAPTLDYPNRIYLDGTLVDPAFINSFSSYDTNNVETKSWTLSPIFYSLLADGIVSLAGTNLAEASGSGSFQVDFMRLDIVTEAAPVPEPSTFLLFGAGLAGVGLMRRKKRK